MIVIAAALLDVAIDALIAVLVVASLVVLIRLIRKLFNWRGTDERNNEVVFDTNALGARKTADKKVGPGEVPVICQTVYEEAVKHHFSTAGLPVVPDGMSAVLRARLAVQMRVFNKNYKRNTAIENDVIIGATALERDSPLITGDLALYDSMVKVRNTAAARYIYSTGG